MEAGDRVILKSASMAVFNLRGALLLTQKDCISLSVSVYKTSIMGFLFAEIFLIIINQYNYYYPLYGGYVVQYIGNAHVHQINNVKEVNNMNKSSYFYERRFLFYLIFLIIAIIVSFFLFLIDRDCVLTIILYFLIPIGGVFTVSSKKRNLIIILSGLVPFIAFNFLSHYFSSILLIYIIIISGFSSYLFSVFLIIRWILKNKIVTKNTIYAAISGYLLLGLIWAFIYGLLSDNEIVKLSSRNTELNFASLIYYSFITLTSVGFGDIVPANLAGQLVTMLEALAGQFYMTILIAILIGKYLGQQKTQE